jgi:hypothetical protein
MALRADRQGMHVLVTHLLEQHCWFALHPKPPFLMQPHLATLHWPVQQSVAKLQRLPSARQLAQWPPVHIPLQHWAFAVQTWPPAVHVSVHFPPVQRPEQHVWKGKLQPIPLGMQLAGPHAPDALQSIWQQSLALAHGPPF